MNNIITIRLAHDEALRKHCQDMNVEFESIQRLLQAERTKKLFKRNALLQQNIEKEIENAIANEN